MSLLRNLATSLVNARGERIVTTLPKAKELRPFIERAVTLSRKAQAMQGEEAAADRLHLRRQAAGFFHAGNIGVAAQARRGEKGGPERTAGVAALKRLFGELGERYAARPGGYTRIIKLGRRDGDNAELAIIEFVGNPQEQRAAGDRKPAADAKKPTRAKKSDAAKSGDDAGDAPTRGRRAKKTEQTSAENDASG